jgi:hypothetical protein
MENNVSSSGHSQFIASSILLKGLDLHEPVKLGDPPAVVALTSLFHCSLNCP